MKNVSNKVHHQLSVPTFTATPKSSNCKHQLVEEGYLMLHIGCASCRERVLETIQVHKKESMSLPETKEVDENEQQQNTDQIKFRIETDKKRGIGSPLCEKHRKEVSDDINVYDYPNACTDCQNNFLAKLSEVSQCKKIKTVGSKCLVGLGTTILGAIIGAVAGPLLNLCMFCILAGTWIKDRCGKRVMIASIPVIAVIGLVTVAILALPTIGYWAYQGARYAKNSGFVDPYTKGPGCFFDPIYEYTMLCQGVYNKFNTWFPKK